MSSFLITRAAVRTAPRTWALAYAPRAFSTAPVVQKSAATTATDTVKDTLKTVDRAVSDKIVDGIEIGEKATGKVQEVTGVGAGEAKGKAEEFAGKASGKASELSGKAKGTAAEVAGKTKAVKEETKAEVKRS